MLRDCIRVSCGLLALAACGDSGGRGVGGSASATVTITGLPPVGTTTSTGEPGTDTTAPTTGTTTTAATTTSDTGSADSVTSIGLCTPGELQCDGPSAVQVCADDGQSWLPPTPCAADQVCDFGVCKSLCAKAQTDASSVGCEYFAVDNNNDPAEAYDSQPYAVVVSNVDPAKTANVQVQTHDGAAWATIQQSQVGPNTLFQFDLPDRHIDYTGVNPRGAYKVVSDVPIIAYQFQPINGETSYTSDASLLLPVNVYDKYYYVVGWGESSFGNAQLNIVAAQDATTVTITPAVPTDAGGALPALPAGQPYTLPPMNEADVIQIESSTNMLSGTYITSDKPIGVFSNHWCANIPSADTCCCDHLEEQVYGLQTWGDTYVASRFPVRNNGAPEPSYWHLFAAEDGTQVHVDRHPEVTGIPADDFAMTKGQLITMTVGGSEANPGDFVVTADKPIYLMQYMSSSANTNVPPLQAGDPAMAQAVPLAQYRSSYVILIPSNWLFDRIVLTKKTGANITLDGAPVAQNTFIKVGASEWEVARVPADDGVHVLTGDQPFGVMVIGYDEYDSYAYPGGLDQKQINPQG
ncbi:IgGFc-binding protein [Nannocystis sp. RBIL2]|uniref:IgGFc-binding protein n=1 Tax=Nannocystis sp. RBIL2 TaxID=2996788 RepID=UPI00226DA206|nr:IgGFc-binding protein [Nannocystis sp. RBIL2]MCY1069973.1 IgGFc-binding protein [Nannocystis sp. RBIL2]